jgi:sulfonate transport system permease protein
LTPNRRTTRFLRVLSGAWLPLLGLLGWELLSRTRTYSYGFAPVDALARSLCEVVADGTLQRSLLASLRRALLALALGVPAGVVLGAALGASRTFNLAVGPFFHAFRQVPYLGLAPLMGLWFGTGDFAKVLLVLLAVIYPVVLSTYQGVRALDVKYIEVARVLKLTRARVFRTVLVPAVATHVYSGLSQAIPFAWIATVGSELLLHSGVGMGALMQSAETAGRLDVVLVCTLSVAAASLALDRLAAVVGHGAMRWRRA